MIIANIFYNIGAYKTFVKWVRGQAPDGRNVVEDSSKALSRNEISLCILIQNSFHNLVPTGSIDSNALSFPANGLPPNNDEQLCKPNSDGQLCKPNSDEQLCESNNDE